MELFVALTTCIIFFFLSKEWIKEWRNNFFINNDSSVRLYTYDGILIHLFVGHENFVFSAKVCLCLDWFLQQHHFTFFFSFSQVLQNGYFGTAGDDGCVKIWKDFECVQSLQHPIGLWDLAQLENGDIIAACQDNLVRVWSCDPSR